MQKGNQNEENTTLNDFIAHHNERVCSTPPSLPGLEA
jgi:hypothetical protein